MIRRKTSKHLAQALAVHKEGWKEDARNDSEFWRRKKRDEALRDLSETLSKFRPKENPCDA